MFVTDKLGYLTVYSACDTYSDSAWSRECVGTRFIRINCML